MPELQLVLEQAPCSVSRWAPGRIFWYHGKGRRTSQ